MAHFHLLYHFGDVIRVLTIRAIAMILLLFIVVGLAVTALSTTSVNYYLMAAVSVFVVWRWAWDCPPRKAGAWNSFSINKQTVGLLSFLLSSSWSVFENWNFWSPTESWYTATCKGTTAEGFASISLAFQTAHGQDAMQAQALRAAASSAYAHAILIVFCVTAALCSFWWQDLSHIYRN